ncbi:MAG: peptidoglycan-binding protein [Lachnospiraceae bacterium]|nr:peptidoglycan-binding protein [Ruminococcus sp.]MCM1275598.1 peptidoglycan-binding protein [Lachnospiraceae bacterium]MCM1276265.1 peptidoglycan-binding protein [Lachnospiraceae bacterium]
MPANLPYIPERIVVHLGTPNASATNVSVTFPDYIKNVASSEIFPTWPEAALRANIYVQISFALNRVYTEWYRSRGYDFDITNSTQYDQAYVYGRDIFANIANIVDEVFNNYIVRRGSVEPLFTMFCNGTTVTCEGLSQWGTVPLANRGYTPYQILQYYYGNDIDIVYNAPVSPNIQSYPGTPFGFGASGNEVRTIQVQLNRIGTNYPAIPKIVPANGIYGESTVEAVRTFQSVFNLPVTGVINKATWYKIKYIFTAVKHLSELTSEGLTAEEIENLWGENLRQGDYGQRVRSLAYYLNVIAYFNPEIPTVNSGGVFNAAMDEQVKAFERFYGLNPDGVVDFRTWQMINQIYTDILNNLPEGYEGSTAALYPGYNLTPGMRNDDVKEFQTYLRVIGQNISGIPVIEATGYFGPETERAVMTFQRLYGLEPSGIVGSPTWDALAKEYNYIRFGTERTG